MISRRAPDLPTQLYMSHLDFWILGGVPSFGTGKDIRKTMKIRRQKDIKPKMNNFDVDFKIFFDLVRLNTNALALALKN